MTHERTGAHELLATAQTLGVELCFANPGTTELGLVDALNEFPGLRPILGLFEGVCTGAADGYARIRRKPAMTLLHLGPGLANGLANLHNARRAHSPIVNVVGDHATWHLGFDTPLTSDIESLARPMSDKVMRLTSTASIESQVRAAIESAVGPPCRVVTLIAPSDLMSDVHIVGEGQRAATSLKSPPAPDTRHLENVAQRLVRLSRPILLLGGDALGETGQLAAARVAAITGARLMMETFPACVELGADLPRLERLAYFPEDARGQIGDAHVLLAGAQAPLSYFGYPSSPSELVSNERLIEVNGSGESSATALARLAAFLEEQYPRHSQSSPERAHDSGERVIRSGPPPSLAETLSPVQIAGSLAALLPESAVVSIEGGTCGGPYLERAWCARRHSVLTNTGGAIGQGLPCALGAALARPDARVVALQSDGGGQYTLQALWTLARERLNVVVLICANGRYGILEKELARAGSRLNGAAASERLTRLEPPRLDWVALAKGYGVPAWCAASRRELDVLLIRALVAQGPSLIEMTLS